MAEALYRKYRPHAFNEVRGQEHVVKALLGALKEKQVAHAYLFSGPRGTGKTTIARILAQEVGCTPNDLVEIDAASNRGIDDVRELRSGVAVSPFESPRKVYIIDEVHMLTKEAFNALLKTLEEPPSHAMFILATTEFDRIPETIVSRCQVFQFKKPTLPVVRKMIEEVAKSEGYSMEESACELIALIADGSFRDAHGTLQKIISATKGNTITQKEAEVVTGAPRSALLKNIIEQVFLKDTEKTLLALSEAKESGVDAHLLIKLLLKKFRQSLLYSVSPPLATKHEESFSEDERVFLKGGDRTIAHRALVELLECAQILPKSYDPYLSLELSLLAVISS